jgi:hypothetical protein
LLQVYPQQAPQLLFAGNSKEEKPFSYLFVNLLLIDLRSSFPTLLGKLNSPDYATTSRRLASAFDAIASFVGFLIRSMDDDTQAFSLAMPPDLLLKLRKSISETLSISIEFLRDRWDASTAGAMGLHPDARASAAQTSVGPRLTLAWDSMKNSVHQDPLILSATRALSIWLREDDNELLRRESVGLLDMLIDLYKSSAPATLDFRSSILVALEGLTTFEEGIEGVLSHDGWQVLSKDLIYITQLVSTTSDKAEAARGVEIVRVLLPIVESERTGTREDWMGLITAVAAWDVPDYKSTPSIQEFQVAVLQLATALTSSAHDGLRKRYVHSIAAILGIATQVQRYIDSSNPLHEPLEDVTVTMGTFVNRT